MKNIIHIQQILEYYDVPQIFIGIDLFGAQYIALLIDDNNEYKYIAIPISSQRYSEYISMKVDLRTVFLSPEIEHSYKLIVYNDNQFTIIETFSCITEDMLPQEGFYHKGDVCSDSIIYETNKIKHPIIHLGFEDSINSHSIELPVLSQVLKFYQSLFTHCYTKVDGKSKDPDHCLKAFDSSVASFNLHLYANTPLGLFGESRIEKTLMALEGLFHFDTEESLRITLNNFKGHIVSSYKNFIYTLLENKLVFKYKWLYNKDGNGPIVIQNRITMPKLETISSVLSESTELENEIKEFIGYFIKIDINNATWKLFDINTNKEYFGISIDGSLLFGITVQSIIYKIVCKETIEYNNINAKEKMTYQLVNISKQE